MTVGGPSFPLFLPHLTCACIQTLPLIPVPHPDWFPSQCSPPLICLTATVGTVFLNCPTLTFHPAFLPAPLVLLCRREDVPFTACLTPALGCSCARISEPWHSVDLLPAPTLLTVCPSPTCQCITCNSPSPPPFPAHAPCLLVLFTFPCPFPTPPCPDVPALPPHPVFPHPRRPLYLLWFFAPCPQCDSQAFPPIVACDVSCLPGLLVPSPFPCAPLQV